MENNYLLDNEWIAIWTKPKKTIHRILNNTSSYVVLILAMLNGINNTLFYAVNDHVGRKFNSLPKIILGCILIGAIFGIVLLYLESMLIKFTGTFLGGKGSFSDIKKVIALGKIPFICGMIMWIPKIILFKQYLFMNKVYINDSMVFIILYNMFMIMDAIIATWGTIVWLKCISKVQKFSGYKVLGNVFLSFLIILPFAILLVYLKFKFNI